MNHDYYSFSIPVKNTLRSKIERELDKLGNPASEDVRNALRETLIIHFISATLVHGDVNTDYLVIEMSVDDTDLAPLSLFDNEVSSLGKFFDSLFNTIGIAPSEKSRYLKRHRIKTGSAYHKNPGLNFSGTPGMSVKRIREEYRFARRIRDHMSQTSPSGNALDVIENLRRDIRNSKLFNTWKDQPYDFTPMLNEVPTPLLGNEKLSQTSPKLIASLIPSFLGVFSWPLLILAGLLSYFLTSPLEISIVTIWGFIWRFLFIGLSLIVASIILFGFLLTKKESVETGDISVPNAKILSEVRSREDQGYMQNHLFGVSRLKSGILRKISLRFTFWIVGKLSAMSFRPGYLSDIGTIHFARWFVIPRTDKLIFCSNYGGSWESYLEDFINKAANGLTGVWSNTLGFPKSKFLFFKGATEGEAFKRWARRQQIPTRFWYCAYPHLTTHRIRMNAAIRKGLATVSTIDEAKAFLSLFASMKQSDTDIEHHELQSLFFGGLGKHDQSACLLLSLPNDVEKAKTWLNQRLPLIGFGSAPDASRVDQLSLSASGLKKLNIPPKTLAQFGFPFLQGMSHPDRSRALGDTGDDDPKKWNWGSQANQVDAAYIIYLADEKTQTAKNKGKALEQKLSSIISEFTQDIEQIGGTVVGNVVTTNLNTMRFPHLGNGDMPREPFGFVDGVSQPIIKGLCPGKTVPADIGALHLSEPGEFILGYNDDRGTKTLLPLISAQSDPENLLPVYKSGKESHEIASFNKTGRKAPRAFARNGTYLVIRQLAQNPEVFDTYLDKAVDQAEGHAGIPTWYSREQMKEYLAAKMVGRWRDGTSLVKHPHKPGTGWNGEIKDRRPDNVFKLGQEDRLGMSCPYGSHIRRSNPRDSFAPHDQNQLDIVNRHRILRRGRFYARPDGKSDAGLLFMCLNADIERQFEFIQQTWCMAGQFMGLENEVDPILGRGGKMGRVTIPTPSGPIFLSGTPDAVTVIGGEYFFLPSRSALTFLGHQAQSSV